MNAATNHPELGAATVLYVDDEEMARKYFVRSFGADYEVLTAAGADDALAVLRDNPWKIGVLVTDYRMPGRDGGDLLRQAAREFPHVVRVLVTAYAEREVLLETVNSGEVFRVLEKPLDTEMLRGCLREACELSRERNAKRQRLLAIDETLGFLAHELNTPLAAIRNFARGAQRRLDDGCMPERQQAGLVAAVQAMDDNARYCQMLLASFVESVRGAGASASGHAGGTAQQMIASLLDTYPLDAAQRSAIRLDIQQDFPIAALPNCVALVLSSILSNALRAVRNVAEPMLCFTVRVAENPQILLADNGPGIPPEVLQRLTVDPVTTHAESGGTGRGMIFCKRIMQSFGGGIRVHSAPGKHTTITLDFPALQTSRNTQ
ncbi:MAG TPA: hybrid sensor histidine kinase/response regulator [Gallionella sp.]|nr:hybrid sensor histidine kinase/response regulator [Gallionella sp.]